MSLESKRRNFWKQFVSCAACGGRRMTSETLNEVERFKMHRHSFAVKRPVEVTVFA